MTRASSWPTRWWPALVGIGLAAFVAFDSGGGSQLAPILAASGFVYLGAAALRKPSASWPLFLATFVVISIARIASRLGMPTFDPTWVLLGAAAVALVYGVLRGALRPAYGLPLQTAAMVVVGVCAATASVIDGALGGWLVALGLLGHAAWDVYHHRINKVVTRSMAEFCGVLDTLLATVVIVAVLRAGS